MFGNIYAADPANWPTIAIILGFFLLIAFPVHEFFHAFMAYRLGDGTAKMFGKLTLNPLAHFHPIGGWMLIISTLLFGLPLGFAATPVNPSNLRGRYAEAYVAAAGPLSNFLIAAVFAIPLRLFIASGLYVDYPLVYQALDIIVRFDILLGLFNLIPIWPLDGGTILLSLVSRPTAWRLRPFFAQYGIFLLIAVIFFGGQYLGRITNVIYTFLVG
jgi:Zn-dependent protease